MKNLRGLMTAVVKEASTKEPEVEIRLTSSDKWPPNRVIFNFKTGQFDPLPAKDLSFDLLEMRSKTILKEDYKAPDEFSVLDAKTQYTNTKEGDGLEELISKEQLQMLDSQPNPFNFSDRVSKTTKIIIKDTSIQTEPPPGTSFSANFGLSDIYDAYQIDQNELKSREARKQLENQETEGSIEKAPAVEAPAKKNVTLFGEEVLLEEKSLKKISLNFRIIERMVSQNIYDEIAQDFKYWEDASDEFRSHEGSLLPLWRFNHDSSKHLTVSCVCWSPVYTDLFAAAYSSNEGIPNFGNETGWICIFTLKNPLAPERALKTSAGVTSLAFHPTIASVLCAGRTDGNVAIYDVRSATKRTEVISTAVNGKHLMSVREVHWINTDPGEDLSFFTVSMDGRVTQWHLHSDELIHTDLLDFNQQSSPTSQTEGFRATEERVCLEGKGTCLAFKPDDESVLIIGSDTGAVFECTTDATTYTLIKYPAHSGPVTAVKWNPYNHKVFLSSSADWTIKLWLHFQQTPLFVLDIGGSVSGICWSPTSSTVIVATSDDGKVQVYDLFVKKCHPLCVQNVVQKRKISLTSLSFSPFSPVVVIGGSSGYLVTMKLSPNLRKIHNTMKGPDDLTPREIEIAKMDRLIDTSKEA